MPVTTDHIKDIYVAFIKSQADYKNRGFRLPKDFEKHFNERFKEQNKKKLIKITGFFLTKWNNIDPYKYFMCGFELYKKRFSYMKFLDEKILLLYKVRDKNEKRLVTITKKGLVDSAVFVKKWMDLNHTTLLGYMNEREGNQKKAVDHYLKNKIDASFFVFLLNKGMILTGTERSVIPYIQKNFRKIQFGLRDIEDFVKKIERRLI